MGNFQAPELAPEQRRAIIMRLDRLGWTQEEVAQVVGVTHQRITQILQEIAELPKLAKNVLASGIPHLEVAERFNLPLQVVWAIDLAGRDDAERLDRLGIKVQPYDVWQFAKCHDLFGSQHPGRIPGEPSCTWVKPAQSTDDDLADFLGDFGAWVTFGGRLVALNVDGTRCAMRE